MKHFITCTLLAIVPVVASAQANCKKVNNSNTTCDFSPSKSGRYVLTATSTSLKGKKGNNPWMETTIYIQGSICASDRIGWEDNVAKHSVMCEANLSANTNYPIRAEMENWASEAAGVQVTVEPKIVWDK